MVTRRMLMTKAPLMAAAPALMGLMPRFLSANQPSTGQLSPAVLNAVTNHFSQISVKAYNHQLTQSDLSSSVEMLTLLRTHFTEVGVDPAFQNLARNTDPGSLLVSTSSAIVTTTYGLFSKAGAPVTLAEIANTFSQIVSPAGLTTIINQGITPSFKKLEEHWAASVSKLPVSLDRNGAAHLRRADACATFNFLSAAIGTAAASLALGCLPEPFFVVICPAVAGLGVIAALVGVVDWIAC